MLKSTRRDLLKFSAAALVPAASLPGCSSDGPSARPLRRYTLPISFIEKEFPGEGGAKVRVRLRAYGGTVPGPLLEVNPGDEVRITLDNQLPYYDSSAWSGQHNVPNGLHSTNLHVHGLDVVPHLFEPIGTADPLSGMVSIAPGESYTYAFTIADDHPTGLNWYHPHRHGSTAVQVVTGMAGLLVVRGAIDEVPEIKAAREFFVVVSDIGLFPSDDVDGLWTYEPRQNAMWQTFSNKVVTFDKDTGVATDRPDLKGGFTTGDYALRYYAVNGTPVFREVHDPSSPTKAKGTALPEGIPTLTMQPGEVVRVRLLNGCSDLAMPLSLAGMPLHLIAMDGNPFDAPRTMVTEEQTPGWNGTVTYTTDAKQLVVAPGNRAEFLLKGEAEGTFELVQGAHKGVQFLEAERKVLARIVVTGARKEMPLPAKLAAAPRYLPLIAQSELATTRTIRFGSAFPAVANKEVGIDFFLNDKPYSEHEIDVTVKVGSSERWLLEGHSHSGAEGHPFHVHVNPFELKKVGDRVQPPGTILDTVWVSSNTTVEAWTRFEEHTGKTVFHCHILPHEDTGMMKNLLIEK